MKTATQTPPCPHCGSTKGRTLIGEERSSTGEGRKVHQSVARVRKFRCFGCGKSYTEESDRA